MCFPDTVHYCCVFQNSFRTWGCFWSAPNSCDSGIMSNDGGIHFLILVTGHCDEYQCHWRVLLAKISIFRFIQHHLFTNTCGPPPMPGLELGSWSLSRETSWCKVKVRHKHEEDCPSSKVRESLLVEGGWWKGTGHDLSVLIRAWNSCCHVVYWPLKTLLNQPSSLQFKYSFSSDLHELGHVKSSCYSDAIVASESTFSTKALSGLRLLLGKWVVLLPSVMLSLCAECLLCLHIEQQVFSRVLLSWAPAYSWYTGPLYSPVFLN